MTSNERIIREAAEYKEDARRLFEDALTALIALAFRYKSMGANFLWDADAVLERECNTILRGLSDKAAAAAKNQAARIIEESDWAEGEDAWESVNNTEDDPILTRFDMVGSHLRELLEIWLALAFVNGLTPGYLKITILRYLTSPYASPLWRGLPAGLLKWGRGYQKNLIDQIALIGTDGIIGAVRYAEWEDAVSRGATYWIWRRGSNYKCEDCEANKGVIFPMEVPFSSLHARCMCWPEYRFEPLE